MCLKNIFEYIALRHRSLTSRNESRGETWTETAHQKISHKWRQHATEIKLGIFFYQILTWLLLLVLDQMAIITMAGQRSSVIVP